MRREGVILTPREREITELFAWGAAKKQVAHRLHISERTVENHARHIYAKAEVHSVNELSAWWFCTNFKISFDLSPLQRSVGAVLLVVLLLPQILGEINGDFVRGRGVKREVRIRKLEDDLLCD